MVEQDIGLVAVFGPTTTKTTSMVESVTSNFEIPHVQVNWSPKQSYTKSTVLNLYPDPVLLSQGLAVLVRHMEWKSYAILYQNSEALIRLQEVLKITTLTKNAVVIKELGSGPDHRCLFLHMHIYI